ncbi:MAG: hypothetical protein JWP19_2135, partial [Rhodoglobus sp.]|nr:hypothetical protein [Rhodoglobus sp.]
TLFTNYGQTESKFAISGPLFGGPQTAH